MKLLSRFVGTTDEPSAHSVDRSEPTDQSKSRRTKFLQGAVVFIVMFVTLWWLLSRGEERSE
ncbi:hypothetical protein C496_16562 [Natronorubrum tibetense GA33]|uniref:Uncharacterized protein n=1 Tax=Natronorubrum tibetense GA33 TaxID=1114856 RepID=L9VPY7_9EURY|nr:hypothetical protein C496_16562 [Natronorubrum tibetense GA33]